MKAINKIKVGFCCLLTLGLVSAVNVSAGQIELTPGLWEHTFKMATPTDPKQKEQMEKAAKAMEKMKEQMANMPPETRQMMEKVMEKSSAKLSGQGVQSPFMNMQMTPDGAKLKVCVTKEDVARGEMPTQSEHCTEHHSQINSKTMKVSFECKSEKNELVTSGETEVTFENSKSYSGKSIIHTSAQGKTQTFQSEQSGKWLSSNCGDIKPYQRKDLKIQ